MCCAIEFIETPLFTRQIKQLATDDELRALQKELIGNPDAGDIIQNTGGLRKIRMATGAQGKAAARGGFISSPPLRLSIWFWRTRKAPKIISPMQKNPGSKN